MWTLNSLEKDLFLTCALEYKRALQTRGNAVYSQQHEVFWEKVIAVTGFS